MPRKERASEDRGLANLFLCGEPLSLSVVAVPFVILWFIPNSMWQARVSAMNSALNSGATRLVASKVEVQKRKIFSLAHIHKSRIFLSTCWTRFAEPMRAL